MIMYATSFIVFIFVSLNLFSRTSCPLWLKLAGSGLVLLVSLKFAIYQVIGGAFFSPSLPRPMILCMEALYGALIVLFFLLILWDIYLLGNWLLSKTGIPIPRNLPSGAIKCGMVVIAIGLGAWGTWQALRVPDVHAVVLDVPGLPPKLEGFKIVQITDTHIGPLLKKSWLREVVAKTNALKPDLIALTGDYVDGYVSDIGQELRPLANLHAKYGVFGVTGNHEYYWDGPAWTDELKRLHVEMLNNSHKTLSVDGEPFVVAGITDLAARRFGLPGPDLARALEGAPEAVRLLLSHQPRHSREYLSQTDIQLSGHTHGGLMFFLRPLVARFNEGFVVGGYKINDKSLYVSPGTGLWNGFSCRIGNPSEITLITLQAAKKGGDNAGKH